MSDMDGKKKLEELVASVEAHSQIVTIASCHDIRSISDAYKAMEAERDALLKAAETVIASWDDRLPDGPEEIRSFEAGGKTTKYWSPTASMVDSPAIASLRAVLKGARHEG